MQISEFNFPDDNEADLTAYNSNRVRLRFSLHYLDDNSGKIIGVFHRLCGDCFKYGELYKNLKDMFMQNN